MSFREAPVDAVMVNLGWARTVNLGMGFDFEAHGMTRSELDGVTQSAYLVGRAIAHLVGDDARKSYSGRAVYAGISPLSTASQTSTVEYRTTGGRTCSTTPE